MSRRVSSAEAFGSALTVFSAEMDRLGHADHRLIERVDRQIAKVAEVGVIAEAGDRSVRLAGVVPLKGRRRDCDVRQSAIEGQVGTRSCRAGELHCSAGHLIADGGELVDHGRRRVSVHLTTAVVEIGHGHAAGGAGTVRGTCGEGHTGESRKDADGPWWTGNLPRKRWRRQLDEEIAGSGGEGRNRYGSGCHCGDARRVDHLEVAGRHGSHGVGDMSVSRDDPHSATGVHPWVGSPAAPAGAPARKSSPSTVRSEANRARGFLRSDEL